MLSMSNASFGYPPPDAATNTAPTVIVRNINRSVHAGQRIGILGANGQGKSTLVKTIARDLKPISGEITEGRGLNVGYFAQQELDVLRPQDTPMEHMIRLARETTAALPFTCAWPKTKVSMGMNRSYSERNRPNPGWL